jgi:hypothetical protein
MLRDRMLTENFHLSPVGTSKEKVVALVKGMNPRDG